MVPQGALPAFRSVRRRSALDGAESLAGPRPMSPVRPSPMAIALVWVSRITTIGLEMVLPGLAGHWLDQQFGTRFLAIVGFAFGMVAGMWHLLRMTRPARPGQPGQDDSSS